MKLDLLTVGEVLVDLTQTGVDERGVRLLAANPGGAPANAAVAAARLGANAAFAGCVGADSFGEGLLQTLRDNQVDVSAVAVDPAVPTTLAVVTVNETGERSFTFYRAPGADLRLRREQIPDKLLESAKIVHFGSVSLTGDPARTATLTVAKDAKDKGALITYDPNYRPALWPEGEDAEGWMRKPLPLVDVLKISDEEMVLLSGKNTPGAAAEALAALGIRLVLITLGDAGVYYRFGELTGTVPGFSVKVADTNGAGDTFFGAVLRCLAKRPAPLEGLEREELENILRFANRAASLTVSRPGAIPAMPRLEELKEEAARLAEQAAQLADEAAALKENVEKLENKEART